MHKHVDAREIFPSLSQPFANLELAEMVRKQAWITRKYKPEKVIGKLQYSRLLRGSTC
jgi:hypothetical protein